MPKGGIEDSRGLTGSRFDGGVGVGNGARRVIVEVRLDVTGDDFSQCVDLVKDLHGRGAANPCRRCRRGQRPDCRRESTV